MFTSVSALDLATERSDLCSHVGKKCYLAREMTCLGLCCNAGRGLACEGEQIDLYQNPTSLCLLWSSLLQAREDTKQCRKPWRGVERGSNRELAIHGRLDVQADDMWVVSFEGSFTFVINCSFKWEKASCATWFARLISLLLRMQQSSKRRLKMTTGSTCKWSRRSRMV